MKRLLLISAILYPLLLSGQTPNSGEYIAVIGKASESFVPDMVTFDFSFNVTEKKQKDAVQKLNEQSEKTIDIISRLGYKTKDIKLSNYELGEAIDYSGDKPKNNGYRASLNFELEIKFSEDDFNVFIDSISANKIPDLTFTYRSSFSDDLRKNIKMELIGKASDNAESVAQTLAQSRKLILGDIYSIEYTDNNFSLYGQGILPPPPPPVDVMADQMAAPKISRRISTMGILTQQEVRIIYKIKR